MKKVVIDGKIIGNNVQPYIISELSANHNGSIKKALDTMTEAKKQGASAVKLQTYTADTMTLNCDSDDFIINGGLWDGYKLYDLFKEAETPYKWHKELFNHARKIDITCFSTPFDESAVDLLEDLNSPAYKIASFEAVDIPLIRYAASTHKPMIISTGMATKDEIGEAVDAARSEGCKDLVLLHCISSYPTPIDQANLRQVAELGRQFNVVPGLSDHTLGTTASVVAVALGACVIEKHFTLNRADKGHDSEFSIEPYELKRLCQETHDAWLSKGEIGFERQPAEAASKIFRRSIYFVRDLPAGSLIAPEDIRRIRPGMGLAPKYYNELIGKRLKINVKRGTPTCWDLFDE